MGNSSSTSKKSICRDVSLKHKNTFRISNKAVFMTDKLWTQSMIKVGFIGGQSWKWAWVAKVITETIMVYANINFQFIFDPLQTKNCDIRISFVSQYGCYSYVGTDALDSSILNQESMNLGWMDAPFNYNFTYNGLNYRTPVSFDRGGYPGLGTTIVHEFGHAMGMCHEHQTPFGNPFVWNTNTLYSYFGGSPNYWSQDDINNNIIDRYSLTNTNGSQFDPDSIMKYSFSSNLLINPSPEVVRYIEKDNFILSDCDKYWLSHNYPGRNVQVSCLLNNPPTPNPTPNPTPQPPNPTPNPTPQSPNPTPQPPNPTPQPPNPTPQPPNPTPQPPNPTPQPPNPTPEPPNPTTNPTKSSYVDICIIFILIMIVAFVIIYFMYNKSDSKSDLNNMT